MFACLYVPPRGSMHRVATETTRAVFSPRRSGGDTDRLVHLARDYSPRVEVHGANLVSLDANGLTKLFGSARDLGLTLRRAAADRGMNLRIAMAPTRTAALLVVQSRSGVTVIEPGQEASTLAGLSLDVLQALSRKQMQESAVPARHKNQLTGNVMGVPVLALLSKLRRWGLRNLGDLARLPSDELFERLGAAGMILQRFARGEDGSPLVPMSVEERFESSLALDHPIEGVEPLSFVLKRLFEQLSVRLERAGTGAAVIHVHLKLGTRELCTRTLQLPTPLRDPRALRTLVLLDLESHLPAVGIDQITVVIDQVPARSQQFSLFERIKPSPATLSILGARLTALVGSRCGSPVVSDSHNAAGFEMCAFAPRGVTLGSTVDSQKKTLKSRRRKTGNRMADRVRWTPLDGNWRQVVGSTKPQTLMPMLRRFRTPKPARVRVQAGRPIRVLSSQVAEGEVVQWAGPWRTSGHWWDKASMGDTAAASGPVSSSDCVSWDHDEWDVALADGGVYRIFHDRQIDRWFVEGMVD
ncbi:MAG: hypothetical protein CL484_15230 [Acidobacteria bacterium]|nr:hypothetical protein [Acidobacteriota bacterium]